MKQHGKVTVVVALSMVGLGLVGCSGGSLDAPTPAPLPTVTGHMTQDLPVTAVSDLQVQFKATITNNGTSALTAASNMVSIADITYPTTVGVTSSIDTTGGVGPGLNCYNSNTEDGAELAPNHSCEVVIDFTNASGEQRTVQGNIVVSFTGAQQSAITYPVEVTFLAQPRLLAQTGQTPTEPIDPAPTGSDGYIQAGIEWNIATRFTDNGNGTMTDTLTGLVWQKSPSAILRTWSNALDTCNALNLGEYTDWRLPNVLELLSLIDLAAINSAAALNSVDFGNIINNNYWTSSTFAPSLVRAWVVNFNSAAVGRSEKINKYFPAWCVRGDTAGSNAPLWQTGQTVCYNVNGEVEDCAGTGQDGAEQAGVKWTINTRFQNNSDTTITDTLTGLVWQQDPSVNNSDIGIDWNIALSICNDLNQGGQTDWRLPNRTELYSLVDWASSSPNNALKDNGFANIQPSFNYWTSSTFAAGTDLAWMVDFGNGSVIRGEKTPSLRAWCVRSGV